jgi:hypothetical protein
MLKIPCSHVIACRAYQNIDIRQYIDSCYKLTEQLANYSESFEPVKDKPYWQPIEGPTLRPDPTMLRQKGQPKSIRIRNGMDWRENQPKPRCGICQEEGHNHRTCPNVNMGSTSGTGTN